MFRFLSFSHRPVDENDLILVIVTGNENDLILVVVIVKSGDPA